MAKATTKQATKQATKAAEKKAENSEPAKEAVTSKIHQSVIDNGGISKVTLGDIRDELGHARLGTGVLKSMADHLHENGLGFFPGWVLNDNPSPRQWEEVHVYERDGSPASVVLDAVSDPEGNDLSTALKMFSDSTMDFSSMKAEQKMALLKSIVCS